MDVFEFLKAYREECAKEDTRIPEITYDSVWGEDDYCDDDETGRY